MNKNKGFIGIGLIVAIVLGIVVVGGGAYFLGKGSNKLEVKNPENILPNNENQNLPVVEKQKTEIVNPVAPQVVTGCTSNSTPSIKVLSPNGGETYTAGQKITVKWSSCNNPYNPKQVIVSLDDPTGFRYYLSGNHSDNIATADTGILTTTLPNVGYVSTNSGSPINFKPGNNFTIMVSAWPQEYEPIWDFSDTSFTINSETKNISTILPAKYLDSQNWPPVVKTSSFTYSCKLSSGSGDVPTVTEEKTINGKKYCIKSLIDAGAGSRFGEYTYMTPSTTGSGNKTASFNLQWSSCGGYGGPGDTEYDACQSTVSTFLNNLDAMVDSLMF